MKLSLSRVASLMVIVSLLYIIGGCASVKNIPKPKIVSIRNGDITVNLAVPDSSFNDEALGTRFLKAGWITSLIYHSKDSDVELFNTDPFMPDYAAFGCAQEFTSAFPLSMDGKYVVALRIGVGVVRYLPNRAMLADIVEHFPWKTTFKPTDDGFVIVNTQSTPDGLDLNGYGYEFQQEIVIKRGSSVIEYRQQLKNRGSKTIDVNCYLHPFFRYPPDRDFAVGNGEFSSIAGWEKGDVLLPSVDFDAKAQGVEIKLNSTLKCGLSTDRLLSKVVIWRQLNGGEAVEPFVHLNLNPGESDKWLWNISVMQSK